MILRVLIIFILLSFRLFAQTIEGKLLDETKEIIPNAILHNLTNKNHQLTNYEGWFKIKASINDTIVVKYPGYLNDTTVLVKEDFDKGLTIQLKIEAKELAAAMVINNRLGKFDIGNLPPIKGVQITTGTNAVIQMESLSGAKSTSNPREMFAKIPGLNIWESDGAGIQIGIGGRGLSPNRAANFNTRQNGYDISADALGYPESYYTPPFEALKSIEITRGSASLQFGTQFGGLLNFIIKDPDETTPFSVTSRLTGGSYGYFGAFNRVSGTKNRLSYQVYHQYKRGNGYRVNSDFTQQQLFGQIGYYLNEKIHVKLEYTHMDYLTQQAGGLTDLQFQENPRASFRDRNFFRVNWNMLATHIDIELSNNLIFNTRAFFMHSTRESLGFLGKVTQSDPMGNRTLIQGLFQNGGIESRLLKKYLFNKKDKERYTSGAFLVGARYYQGSSIAKQGDADATSLPNFTYLNPSNLENSSYSFPSINWSLFAENILFLTSKITLNAGVRYENIQSSAEGFYKRYAVHPFTFDTLAVYTINDERTVKRSLPLFGCGASFKTSKTNSVYLNFTQNYRAINFTDIRVTNPNIIIDTLMKDENGFTGELGYRGVKKDLITFDVALFYLYYGNKIGLAPKSGTIYKERTNIGDALNVGFESFIEIDLMKLVKDSSRYSLNLFTNIAYIHAQYIRSKEPNFVGKEVEYVSPFIFKTGLKFKSKKFTSQIQLSYNSRQFSDASNAIEPSGDALIGLVPAYTVLDFSMRYDLNNAFTFESGVNNLTNNHYFTRRAISYPGPGIIPSDGISCYVTLVYRFKK